ncbi:ThiF family adenylyltransferase [Lactobacillus sp. DCY120]|uniref:ThiF family adenylyltransferase n=1 Tax=Bombilactobacillus apium TaxID=2675299 RepID=A0A850RBH5_9LACO|nr:ThiF family adenylyltransferase [Bombilactobacillus apium]NVY96148.1 ThiF family adenylyltransferase [Bombilactobacillus apium]
MYNLKKIGWYLSDEGKLFVYKGNPRLEREINSDNNEAIFAFIKAFKRPMSEAELQQSLPQLSRQEFADIFAYFKENKWLYKLPDNFDLLDQRIKNFADCYPGITYTDYIEKVADLGILILGLGTGGSYLLDILTKLGFRNFTIVDGDQVERKNLRAQNYEFSDLGKFKATVQSQKYQDKFPGIQLKVVNKQINSFADLDSKVNLNEIDYFINCADDFDLQMVLLEKLFDKYPKLKMFYGGYSFLIHSDTLITQANYQSLLKTALNQRNSLNIEKYISENSGSIFNGYLSAFFISKVIFNDLIGVENTSVVGDLCTDEYLFR